MRRRTILLCVLGAAVALGVFRSYSLRPRSPAEVDEALLTLAYDDLLPRLRDPASGQFSGLVITGVSTAPRVCGNVNGANAFGGMAGPMRFIRRIDTAEVSAALPSRGSDASTRALSTQIAESEASLDRARRLLGEAEAPPEPLAMDDGSPTFEKAWLEECSGGRKPASIPAIMQLNNRP